MSDVIKVRDAVRKHAMGKEEMSNESDTPRTDSNIYCVDFQCEWDGFDEIRYVKPDFARNLERRLREAEAIIQIVINNDMENEELIKQAKQFLEKGEG